MRVAILADINNYDPQQFLTVNFPIIKNLYDSLIEYTPDGKAVPSLASAWTIAPDNKSVALTLRKDVKFQSGAPFNAAAVDATLKKAADPQRGKNVYATMSIVKDWKVADDYAITVNFKAPAPDKQITDLLQFISIIDPAGIDTVETKPAGTGAYMLGERVTGQRIRLVANPHYWREKEPVSGEVVLTIFSDDAAATAALESGAVDMVYGGSARSAVRLRGAGYQLVQGPGPLVQVFRINSTRGPFRNEKFRQAFNHLMDRANMLRVGYAGLGEAVALPWAPASPAFDKSYNEKYPFDLDKAKALLSASGLSAAEMSNWKLLVNGGDEPSVVLSQIVQNTLGRVGIKIDLDMKQGSEFVDSMLGGKFDAMFGAIGNIQKFPSRLATNSIYRTSGNPVLGDPNPHKDYVAAIERVNAAFGADVKASYDNLNQVLVKDAFGVPTNTYDSALMVAAKNLSGFTLDIDNMLVARTLGMKP
ncbi:MAG: peptide ABC transporter substrate-binding protein [Rhizobiales bacterium 65-9]|nr:MAG: peptide ABC transporter substrate-binding protein [Rhizobiales bacterium 65-9]